MTEIFRWAAACGRVAVAAIFALTPGMVFWLLVIGVMVAIQRVRHTRPYQSAGDRIRAILKPFTQKTIGNTK